ncbi:MAG: hypothetical protein EXQ63_07435 [Ilumatobacteraceae bacterium]|nr:hypothetical protein [Ilumatobacteraceae bacterium]
MVHPLPCRGLRALLVVFALLGANLFLVLAPLGAGHLRAAGVDDKQREVVALADELERLTERMDALGEDYSQALTLQDELSVELQVATDEVGRTEQALAQMRGTLYVAAVSQFMQGGRKSTLTNLLATTDRVQDSLQRQQFTSIALNAGSMSSDKLDSLATDLNKQRKKLEKKQEQAQKLAATVLSRQSAAQDLAAIYEQRQSSATGELAELLRLERNRRSEAAFEEAKRISDGYSSKYASSRSQYKNLPKVSARNQTAINAALSQLGVPYRYGRNTPDVAFDCSGLTTYAWAKAGVGMPRNSRQQYNALPHIPQSMAMPGDLVFSGSPIHHVGIYLGGGRVVHAPQYGDVVKISAVNWGRVVGVARPG